MWVMLAPCVFSDTPQQKSTFLVWGGVEIQIPHVVSKNTTVGKTHHRLEGVTGPGPCTTFIDPSLVGHWNHSSWSHRDGRPGPLSTITGHSLFCGPDQSLPLLSCLASCSLISTHLLVHPFCLCLWTFWGDWCL